MKVEVLYFEGCPHYEATIDLVRDVLTETGVDADVREVEVRDHEEATRLRFLGSPSVRVAGVDIEPGARSSSDFALGCRIYQGSGVPPRALLVAALRGRE